MLAAALGAGAVLLGCASEHGHPAGMDGAMIAFCRPATLDSGRFGGCVCSAEGIEDALARDEYLRVLAMWRRATLLTPYVLSALDRDRRAACGEGGGTVAAPAPAHAVRAASPRAMGDSLTRGRRAAP